MGITGLLPCLKSIATSINVKEYQGQRVAVDAYCWLHKGAYACSYELCQNLPTDKYINYCMHRVNLLRHNNITPVLVFDGGPLPNKRGQEEKRRSRRQEHREKALNFLRQGNRAAANECFKKAVDITPLMAHKLIKILRQEGIECIVAPYEADAQLAFLAHTGYVHAIITEDSDLLPYGCTRVLFKMDQYGNGEEINLKNLALNTTLNFTNWNIEMFRNMCILSGCDYLPSIMGMGLKKAYTLINKYKHMDRVFRFIRADRNLVLPPDYIEGFTKAEQTFLHQRVFDHINKKLVPLTPFPEHIVDGGDMDFLGPIISDEIALQIALGDMDPYSFKHFEEPAAPPQTMRVTTPVSTRGRLFPGMRRSLSRPLLLPQKNVISNYFTPTSKGTLKPFAPPRSSQEEDSVESSEGENVCPPSPLPPSDLEASSIETEPYFHKSAESKLKRPCSPPPTQRTPEILVARTPSPQPAKRRKVESSSDTGEVKVVVTSRFFNVPRSGFRHDNSKKGLSARQPLDEENDEASSLATSAQAVPEKQQLIDLTEGKEEETHLTEVTAVFESPLTSAKRLSTSRVKAAKSPSLLGFFAKYQTVRHKATLSLQDDGLEVLDSLPEKPPTPHFSEVAAGQVKSPYFA